MCASKSIASLALRSYPSEKSDKIYNGAIIRNTGLKIHRILITENLFEPT